MKPTGKSSRPFPKLSAADRDKHAAHVAQLSRAGLLRPSSNDPAPEDNRENVPDPDDTEGGGGPP